MTGGLGVVEEVKLPSVDRTVDVIDLLSGSTRGLTLSEICRAIGIPKSSAHYLIQTLISRGYLYRNTDGRTYSIGLRMPESFDTSGVVRDLQAVLRVELLEVARVLGLTAVATILKGAEAVIIEKKNSPGKETRGNWGNWIGRHIDVHCTSQGKVHLAYLTESELGDLFKERPLARFTPKTIRSIESLRIHLATVRSDGFAINDEEHIIGVRGVAAPIFNHVGRAIAAVGVTGSVKEMPRGQIPTIARQVISMATEVSRIFLDRFPAIIWIAHQHNHA
jgi:IclR family transcriptional regulator, KDG regulon repressor